MSVGPVATAFVKVVPDATGFRAELEKAVKLAVAQVERSGAATVKATVSASATAAAGTGGGTAAANAASTASKRATTNVRALANESNAARGALIGLSRITPVTVFGLGLYGSAAIVAGTAIKRAISATADFEHQLNILQATSQATTGEMKEIHDEALRLGADLSLPSVSAGDAARAMTELSKAGLSVKDTLEGARGVLQLSAAAEIDVGSAAIYVATALNAFNLAGTDATHVADLLAGASIAAQGSIDDFGLGMQQVSAVSVQVGLSLEETTGALTELARAGLRGSDGGTSLRTTLLRLAPTTKQASQYMDALGISIDKTRSIGDQLPELIDQYRASLQALDPVTRQQALAQIFGQDAIRAASILIRGGSQALDENTRAADRNGAAAQLAAANAKGLSGAYNGLKSNLDTLGVTLGEVAKGPMTTFINDLGAIAGGAIVAANALIDLGSAISSLPTPDLGPLNSIIKYAAIGAAVPGLAPIIIGGKLLPGQDQTGGPGPDPTSLLKGGRGGIDPSAEAVKQAKLSKAKRDKIRAAIKALQESGEKPIAADKTAPIGLETAQLNAQLAGSLRAELAADKAIEAYFRQRLTLAKKGTGRYLIILTALQSANAASRSVQAQIDSEAKAAADAAESARKKRKAEAEAEAKAAAQAAEDLFNLQKSRFDLQIQRVTTLFPKNKRLARKAYEDEIAFLNGKIKELSGIKTKTTEIKQKIVSLKGDVIALKGAIKDLNKAGADDTDGGFTLNDLFKEAVNQLNNFGSNISASPTTGGTAASATIASIVSRIPSGNPALKKLEGVAAQQLAEAAESNDLLAGILAALERTPGLPPGTKKNGRIYGAAAGAAVGASNVTGQ